MYFNLRNGVDLVKGENNYLIIDITNKQIYSIDKKFYLILKKCIKGKHIETITDDFEFLFSKLQELQLLGLGTMSQEYNKIKGKILNKNRLGMLWLNVTSRCNFKCIHCYEKAGETLDKEILKIGDYDKILRDLTKHFAINCVQITGGEPLLRGKNFIRSLLEILVRYKIPLIEIYTNLSLIDLEYLEMFKNFNVCIATSLYSKYDKVHDSITKVPGSHKNLIKNLMLLKKNDIPFRVGIIIMKQNEMEKDDLRNWVNKKFNLNEIKKYDIIRPVGRALNINLSNMELFNKNYLITSHTQYKNYNFERYEYNKIFNSCWGDKVCIKSNGNIFPCVMSNIRVGNYKNLTKLLLKSDSYRYLTKDKIKVCNGCEYRYLCLECRAIYSKDKKELKDKPFVCLYNTKTLQFSEVNDENKN